MGIRFTFPLPSHEIEWATISWKDLPSVVLPLTWKNQLVFEYEIIAWPDHSYQSYPHIFFLIASLLSFLILFFLYSTSFFHNFFPILEWICIWIHCKSHCKIEEKKLLQEFSATFCLCFLKHAIQMQWLGRKSGDKIWVIWTWCIFFSLYLFSVSFSVCLLPRELTFLDMIESEKWIHP